MDTNNRRNRVRGEGQPLRALFQNRPNAMTQRGGDTVVMEYLLRGLEAQGVQVTLDLESRRDPADFDVVHLFNFATPEITRQMAERAHSCGVPFVVTTLNEDVPTFHNQSLAVASCLVQYVRQGQNREWYAKNRVDVSKVPPSDRFENAWTAQHAAALFSNGAGETRLLQREYPGCKVVEIKLGYEVPAIGKEDFVSAFGVKDFVLCVGRLESRKNQLMLLKALEDSDLTVVLASGGFTYQPDYADAVRKFKRKGRTIVLDRLSAEMLAGAYDAAKVHALPSWYELPGLVSLEAAYHGCNIVATARGTTEDYLGDAAFYCDPSNAASIMNAVVAAYYTPFREQARAAATSHTWAEAARTTKDAYEKIVESASAGAQDSITVTSGEDGARVSKASPLRLSVEVETTSEPRNPHFDFSRSATDFQEVLERGEIAARNRDYNIAHSLLEQASSLNPASARALRARGAVFLAENNVARARECLGKASEIDPKDSKTLSGLAMCECMSGEPAKAYPYLLRAVEIEPAQLITILQLVECSYALNRYDDLERVLRRYLEGSPNDAEMQYCLAGCLYKMGRIAEASAIVERVLEGHPAHVGSVQLKEILDGELAKATPPKVPSREMPAPVPDIEFRLALMEDGKKRKQFSKVKQDCAEIISSPDVAAEHKTNARLILAEIHALEGDISSADSIYDSILHSDPRHTRAVCGKAAIAASRGDFAEAEKLFENAAEAQPGYDLALAGLGLCAYARQDFEASWIRYSESLASNPENSRALLGLIELGYRLNRLPQIEEALSTYLSMHPGDLNFIYSLAGCLYAQNKLESALEEVEKILVFDSGHRHASELRDVIMSRRSKPESARAAASATSRA